MLSNKTLSNMNMPSNNTPSNKWFPSKFGWTTKRCLRTLKPLIKLEVILETHKKQYKCVLGELVLSFQNKEIARQAEEEKKKSDQLNQEAVFREEKWNIWNEDWKEMNETNYYTLLDQIENHTKSKSKIPKMFWSGIHTEWLPNISTWMPSNNQLLFENVKKVLNWEWKYNFNIVLDEMMRQFKDKKLLELLKIYAATRKDVRVVPIVYKQEEKKEEEDDSVEEMVPIIVTFENENTRKKRNVFKVSSSLEDGFEQVVSKKRRRDMKEIEKDLQNRGITIKSKVKKVQVEKKKTAPITFEWLAPSDDSKKVVQKATLQVEEKSDESDSEIVVTYSKKSLTPEEEKFQNIRAEEKKIEAQKKNEINRNKAERQRSREEIERKMKEQNQDGKRKRRRNRKKTNTTPAPTPAPSVQSWTPAPWANMSRSKVEIKIEIPIQEQKCYPEIKIEVPSQEQKCPEPEKVFKSQWCSHHLEGKCSRKVCNFAHNLKEFKPMSCKFGDKCRFVDQGCYFQHPGETAEKVACRCGYLKNQISKPTKCVGEKCSQICKYRSHCVKSGCTFAHTLKEYNPTHCKYSSCKRGDCYYLHPGQKKEDLWNRR